MKNDTVNDLRLQVYQYQSRIDSTPIEFPEALEFWFNKLDAAKRNLLKFGKLAVIVDEVANNEN
ncbi:hypothetical protein HC026_12135 [Lactobacillus sp. LC28-10]|uniref:Uncharacterized protein n=1 Tax=Secundilactobacillus angelensis TaxID=2722706 RepID=A0ABX1L0B4_9LACO|nr:hypothetical protein [Secundilactobacillus angelensis]MCH5463514.1 hypothetical protein [Secundilactobacillus angelensis]NLR19636.1 hypothetical protein [Secundilactobacillus angelensis]